MAPIPELAPSGRSTFQRFRDRIFQTPLYRDAESLWRRDLLFPITPDVDVAEKDNAYEITAELPGLDIKDITLQVKDGVLTIKGEKKEEKEEKTKDRYVSERRYGSFHRSLQLPPSVDIAKIVASYHGGVLTVTLPRSAEAQKAQKTIPITAK